MSQGEYKVFLSSLAKVLRLAVLLNVTPYSFLGRYQGLWLEYWNPLPWRRGQQVPPRRLITTKVLAVRSRQVISIARSDFVYSVCFAAAVPGVRILIVLMSAHP